MKISLCMIVKNEEKYIAQCLKSAALLVDEIIIVDTGSTDNTLEIASEFQPKIFRHPWENDFGKARNHSLAQATGDWVLVLDADESLYMEDIQKLKDILKQTKANGVSLKFHNFIDEGSEENYNTHMGVRIFKNHCFHYQGAIHEQLMPINNTVAINIETTDVRVRHFGYLKSNSGKKKRERNIPIIQRLLDENPQDSFQLFNMGNEYMSDDDYNKALLYFEKAYENKDVTLAYCPHLIFRRAICLHYLKRDEESLAILGEGVMLYPKCIDYEYLRGRIYKSHKQYSMAIASFEKCISIGAAPLNLTFFSDTEGFRSFVELGHIYFLQDDFEKALSYYLKALGLKNNHYELLYKCGELFNKMHSDKNLVGARLEKLFADGYYINNVLVIVDVLLKERLYPQAAEYFKRIEDEKVYIEDILYLKGRLLFYQKDYENAFNGFVSVIESENDIHLLPEVKARSLEYAVICYLASKQNGLLKCGLERINPLVEAVEDEEKKQVLLSFIEKTEVVFAESAKPGIYRMLSEILQIAEFELFEQNLPILNQIDSKEVLLDLANIYYINGYKEMALKNIMRSIKELDIINANAVQILNKEFLLSE